MFDEPANCGVGGSIGGRVPVRSCWCTVDFVSRRSLIRYPPPRLAGIGADKDNQRHDSDRTENTKEDYWYKPRSEALADLEDRGGNHGRRSEISSSKERQI